MKKFFVSAAALAVAICACTTARKTVKPDSEAQPQVVPVRDGYRPVLITLEDIALQMDVPVGDQWNVEQDQLTAESASPTRVVVTSADSYGIIKVDAYRTEVGSPKDMAARQAELLMAADGMVISPPSEDRVGSAVSFTYDDFTDDGLAKGKVITLSPAKYDDVVLLIQGRWPPFLNDDMTAVIDAMAESVAVAWPPQDT
ncbi:MAG: hypothetical protein AAB692_00290 [Patescibacteria group bacterium]